VADAINLPDFYNAHMLNYCEGDLKADSQEVSKCTERQWFFNIDPVKKIEESLPSGVTLERLQIPDEVVTAGKAIGIVGKAMFFFFFLGSALLPVGVVTSGIMFMAFKKMMILLNVAVAGVSRFPLLVTEPLADPIASDVDANL
jgi:hypothetical protein